MGESSERIRGIIPNKPVRLTKPFAMMATLTTQIIWEAIAEAARARFPNKYQQLNSNPSGFWDLRIEPQTQVYEMPDRTTLLPGSGSFAFGTYSYRTSNEN